MWGISYWAVPIFSSLVWLAMLIAMLTTWVSQGRPHYDSMDPTQTIAYISDVGASGLKPLFITMSAVTVVTFDLSFILERWLRHTGKLHPNTSIWQKIYSGISLVAAIAGAAGLILLSIFDTLRHNRLHNIFLAVFIIGYVLSAIFICWEYQRLGIHFREHSVLRLSFWIKLAFIIIEVALAIGFGVMSRTKHYDTAAILEWTIAFVYFFYVLSFFIDFMPASRGSRAGSGVPGGKHGAIGRETEMEAARGEGGERTGGLPMGDGAADGGQYFRNGGRPLNGHANGYTTNGNAYANGNGYVNGGAANYARQPEPAALPSRNF